MKIQVIFLDFSHPLKANKQNGWLHYFEAIFSLLLQTFGLSCGLNIAPKTTHTSTNYIDQSGLGQLATRLSFSFYLSYTQTHTQVRTHRCLTGSYLGVWGSSLARHWLFWPPVPFVPLKLELGVLTASWGVGHCLFWLQLQYFHRQLVLLSWFVVLIMEIYWTVFLKACRFCP